MKYKIIAFDLDGTLLDDEKNIPPENLDAMKRAAELGIILAPATGRIYNGIPATLRELPFIRYCICMNGAWVGDVREKRTLYSAEIPAKRAVELLRFMDGLPVIYDCYQDDWGWMSRSMYEKVYEYVSDKKVAELTQRTRNQVDDLKALLLERGRPVQKMQMHFKDHAARLEWLEKLPKLWPDISVTSSIASNIELNAAAANKGEALLALCSALKVAPEDSIAFGDGTNDISMLRAAGVGVAMENAEPEVKAAADMLTGNNNAAGVAQAIRRLVPEIGGDND